MPIRFLQYRLQFKDNRFEFKVNIGQIFHDTAYSVELILKAKCLLLSAISSNSEVKSAE